MFDLPPESIAFIDRMRGHQRSAQAVNVSKAELDAVVEQLIVPLFQKQGLDVTSSKDDDGHTIRINY